MSNIISDMGIGQPKGLTVSDKQILADIANIDNDNLDTIKEAVVNTLNAKFNTSLSVSTWNDILNYIDNLDLGNATPDKVLIDNTFSSNNGIKIPGTATIQEIIDNNPTEITYLKSISRMLYDNNNKYYNGSTNTLTSVATNIQNYNKNGYIVYGDKVNDYSYNTIYILDKNLNPFFSLENLYSYSGGVGSYEYYTEITNVILTSDALYLFEYSFTVAWSGTSGTYQDKKYIIKKYNLQGNLISSVTLVGATDGNLYKGNTNLYMDIKNNILYYLTINRNSANTEYDAICFSYDLNTNIVKTYQSFSYNSSYLFDPIHNLLLINPSSSNYSSITPPNSNYYFSDASNLYITYDSKGNKYTVIRWFISSNYQCVALYINDKLIYTCPQMQLGSYHYTFDIINILDNFYLSIYETSSYGDSTLQYAYKIIVVGDKVDLIDMKNFSTNFNSSIQSAFSSNGICVHNGIYRYAIYNE